LDEISEISFRGVKTHCLEREKKITGVSENVYEKKVVSNVAN